MFNLLVLLLVIKFYVHSNVFKLIKKKHEQDAITAVHNYKQNYHDNNVFELVLAVIKNMFFTLMIAVGTCQPKYQFLI